MHNAVKQGRQKGMAHNVQYVNLTMLSNLSAYCICVLIVEYCKVMGDRMRMGIREPGVNTVKSMTYKSGGPKSLIYGGWSKNHGVGRYRGVSRWVAQPNSQFSLCKWRHAT